MFALKHGKGSCDEISDLAIAILRACGIYARSVVGYILYEGLHEWLEIKTTQGWIPIDPTIGLVGGLGARWLKILVEQKPSMKLYRIFGKGRGTLDLRLIIDSREILHKKLTLTLKRK